MLLHRRSPGLILALRLFTLTTWGLYIFSPHGLAPWRRLALIGAIVGNLALLGLAYWQQPRQSSAALSK